MAQKEIMPAKSVSVIRKISEERNEGESWRENEAKIVISNQREMSKLYEKRHGAKNEEEREAKKSIWRHPQKKAASSASASYENIKIKRGS